MKCAICNLVDLFVFVTPARFRLKNGYIRLNEVSESHLRTEAKRAAYEGKYICIRCMRENVAYSIYEICQRCMLRDGFDTQLCHYCPWFKERVDMGIILDNLNRGI